MQEFHYNQKSTINEGHRARMYQRFLSGDMAMGDVEITEMLLFYCIPHKDVKPLAKELLKCFGTVQGVINAPAEALLKVKGVGEKTATFFKIIAEIVSRGAVEEVKRPPSASGMVEHLKKMFKDENKEILVIMLLGKNDEILHTFTYTENKRTEINVSLNDLAVEVAAVKPQAAVMAHNHLGGIVTPSDADDMTTRKIMFMLGVQGVTLYDHFIFCGDEYYSYYISGRLDDLKASVRRAAW